MVLSATFIIILNCSVIFSPTQLPPMGLHQGRKFIVIDLRSFHAQLFVFPLVLCSVDDVTIEQVV